jgi:hypothetical protein
MLDDQGLIPERGHNFFATASRQTLGPAQPPIQWVLGALSLGVKQPGCEADHSLLSSAKVKSVELYLHSPYIFMAWCLRQHRDKFTLTLNDLNQLCMCIK